MTRINKKSFLFFVVAGLIPLLLAACGKDQFGDYFQETFSVTPRCGTTDKLFHFQNADDQPLVIVGIAFAAGTNADAHFSIQGIQIGQEPEIPPGPSGGITDVTIPAGATYTLRVRYSPTEESNGTPHTAIIDIAYSEPAGVVQLEVSGTSEGEADCPEIEEGGPVGLDGPVTLTITELLAATNQVAEPLRSDKGIRPFEEVDLTTVVLDAEAKSIDFPQITTADRFILPPPNDENVTLVSLVFTDTFITTRGPLTGEYDPDTGSITLENLKVDLVNQESEINLTVTELTTGALDHTGVVPVILDIAGFTIIEGKIVGAPIQPNGTLTLVGMSDVDKATGKLGSAQGKMAVQIKATITCTEETLSCDFGGGESE